MAAAKKMMKRDTKRLIFYVAVMALPIAQISVFYVYMNVNSVMLAFRRYDVASGNYLWAGLDNFKRVFTGDYGKASGEIGRAILNSLLAYGISLAVVMPLGLMFSYYMYKKMRGNGLFKVILFLPQIVSPIVMVVIYKYFVEDAVPAIMKALGGEGSSPLSSRNMNEVLATIMFFSAFISFGSSALIYTGTMSGVSDSIIEAAKLDGIGPFKEFTHIVLPQIYPTVVTFMVVGIAGIFTNQIHMYSFYGAGANTKLSTLGYYLYKALARANSDDYPGLSYPYLSAFGLTMTLIAVPLTLIIRKFLERIGPSNG